MSRESKRLQKLALIKQRGTAIREIATKHGWIYSDADEKTYKLSFIDKLGIYRADVFLSTFTVGLLPIDTGSEMKWFKKVDYDNIKDIFKNPTKYEIK